MSIEYILIVLGEPYSTFNEIIGKYFKKIKKYKKKIILIGNKKLLEKQIKILNQRFPINEIKNYTDAKKNMVNIINIEFNFNKIFDKISSKSNKYIERSFDETLKIIKKNNKKFVLINGPISKKNFLRKNYLGITEYLSKKTNSKNQVMLIYNDEISVSPITTHLPIKYVTKNLNKQKIIENILTIDVFYKKVIRKKAKFAILGLNPHCETIDKLSEEDLFIKPSIKNLKAKGIDINGPFSADTFFLKKNLKKFDVVIGMYHDQVLTPIKTIYEFKAINITLGLPFIRMSPDHGPNSTMLGKNKSDPSSFYYAMKFAEKLK